MLTTHTQTELDQEYSLNDGSKVTAAQLRAWDKELGLMKSPEDRLRWAITMFPNIYQLSGLGLTGLVITDMLSKLTSGQNAVPMIFIDTLHLFPETLKLLGEVKSKYYKPCPDKVNVFRPSGVESEEEFAAKYGSKLWEIDQMKYDFVSKIEPAYRAYKQLKVSAVFTGRRRSQQGDRVDLPYIELDQSNSVIKINPLADYEFAETESYVLKHKVPRNELLKLGFKSIGDYHSTEPVGNGEDERAGRWKGKSKTECGIHQASKYAAFLKEHQNNSTM
ncbi:HDL334Cp [Eremothecium sinecaudum]|uniref:HDL334Cp n=1 Tax=Eremothecium sinecaudum TaxID=45286 RepID=A0A0X8HS10_9SACH|nr:HDL334Cp [Eremothecium sinecaudum]AMD20410.1 HDL334Cp [Eremothecium sinecaudum]